MRSVISFNVRGRGTVKFAVEHNVHHFFTSIEAAVENWIVRTPPSELTGEDFVKYVKNKDPLNIHCELVSLNPDE